MCSVLLFVAALVSCDNGSYNPFDPANWTIDSDFVASYQVARESVLRQIPAAYINAARTNLHVAYQHSSHGTHVSRGLWGLQEYKTGDDVLFAVAYDDVPAAGELDFKDYLFDSEAGSIAQYITPYCQDLTTSDHHPDTVQHFVQATRAYLDDPTNAAINVVMWSWCSIRGADMNEYVTGMQTLIDEYGPGGTEPRAATNPVTFVFMTGHAEANDNVGEGSPRDQAQAIVDYCDANDYYCLDYYGIDTRDMNDQYWEDAGDDGNSATYGGGFYTDWQNSHTEGTDWYLNIDRRGIVQPGAHNTQHITANRKAYAFWWILARIAGWDGVPE